MNGVSAAAIIGSGPKARRHALDFYATPPEATEALLQNVALDGRVWEPACGDGAMARVIEAHGYQVVGTDIEPRGYGMALDFLRARSLLGDSIVTNPPFSRAYAFAEHALRLKPRLVALLLKSQFWHAVSRLGMFTRWPPAEILALTWRPDFDGRGAPTMDLIWTVWRDGCRGPTIYRPVPKPALRAQLALLPKEE